MLEHEARQQLGFQQRQQMMAHDFCIGIAQQPAPRCPAAKGVDGSVAARRPHVPAALADIGATAFGDQQAAHGHHLRRIQQTQETLAKVAQRLRRIVIAGLQRQHGVLEVGLEAWNITSRNKALPLTGSGCESVALEPPSRVQISDMEVRSKPSSLLRPLQRQ